MRLPLLLGAVLALLGGPALAGLHYGGVLVAHSNPGLVYTQDDLYCGSSGILDCEDGTVRVDGSAGDSFIIHVLASTTRPDA